MLAAFHINSISLNVLSFLTEDRELSLALHFMVKILHSVVVF